jgi:arylsulfatase A-like enzyme
LDHPRDQGFETYAGVIWNFGGTKSDYFRFYKIVNGQRTGSLVYETTSTTNDAIRQIATLPEPWFLYVNYHAPHAPIHAPPDDLHSFTLSGDPDDSPVIHSKAMTEALDTEMGRLLGHVDYETTTIIFLGDNGTGKDASEAPFLPEHAKGTLYEGGINVPLIVAGASAVPGVRVVTGECAALVHLVDIFATVSELSGFANTSEDSVSMVPYFQGDHTPLREFVYSEHFKPNGAGPYNVYNRTVRGLRYKLIRRMDGEELYDLETDPFEKRDLLRQPFLTPEQRAAYQALDAELTRIRNS